MINKSITSISIVIPTLKPSSSLFRLLDSLKACQGASSVLQVIVVNNLEKYSGLLLENRYLGDFADFKYLTTGSIGVNKARNLGLRYSSGEVIWFLDDDCIVKDREIVLKLINLYGDNPNADGIGGYYCPLNLSQRGAASFYHQETLDWLDRSRLDYKIFSATSQLVGGNCSYRRRVFDWGIMFNPQIEFGGAEEGFNVEVIRRGGQLFITHQLDIFHDYQLSWVRLFSKKWNQGMGHIINLSHAGGISVDDYLGKKNITPQGRVFYQQLSSLAFNLGKSWGQYKHSHSSLFGLVIKVVRVVLGFLYLEQLIHSFFHRVVMPLYTHTLLAFLLWFRHHILNKLWWPRKGFHFFKTILSALYIRVINQPYHFLKKRIWYPKKLFYFFKKVLMKLYLIVFHSPFHFLKKRIWYPLKIYYFIKSHAWRLLVPFYFLYFKVLYFLYFKVLYFLYFKVLLKPYYVICYNYRYYLKPIKKKN